MSDKTDNVIDNLVVNNHALLNKSPNNESVYKTPDQTDRNKTPGGKSPRNIDNKFLDDVTGSSEIFKERNKTPGGKSPSTVEDKYLDDIVSEPRDWTKQRGLTPGGQALFNPPYTIFNDHVRIGNKVQAGIIKCKLNLNHIYNHIFIKNESEIHLNAKNRCKKLFEK